MRRRRPRSCDASRQRGLTLVELMVAIVIALFVLLGVTVVFVNVKQAFNTQDELSQLQDNERLTLMILTNSVQSAAYFPDPVAAAPGDSNTLPAAANETYGDFAAGQGIVGTSGKAGDTLSTRYVSAGGDGLMNCLGQTQAARTTFTNTFSVTTDQELACSVDGGTTTVPLVSNVTALSVRYGTDTGGTGNADRYLAASAVTAASLWPQVRTARITVTFANPFAGEAGQPATIDWIQTVNLMNKT
jgi:type IV pilus assembly protein PilW